MASSATLDFKSFQDRKLMTDEKSNDGYTKLPNAVVDEHLKDIDNVSELKVTIVVIRKTIGYQKKSDIISTSQFEEITGLAHQSVIDGLKLALDRGIISRERIGQYWSYSVKVVQPVDTFIMEGSPASRLEVVQPVDHLSPKVVQPVDTQKKGLNKTLKKLATPKGVAATPQKSSTIDLSDYTAKEPEPQPEETIPDALTSRQEVTTKPGPATNKGRARVGVGEGSKDSKHIPAQPQLDLGQEVKGFEAGGGGRDMTSNSKARDKPKEIQHQDERLDHPAVMAYTKKFKITPDDNQRDLIVTQITDLGEWEKALAYWKDNKYRPLSVGKIVDCYCKRSYEHGGNGQQRGSTLGFNSREKQLDQRNPVLTGTGWGGGKSADELQAEWDNYKL
jgi:phage replication O-like protein O